MSKLRLGISSTRNNFSDRLWPLADVAAPRTCRFQKTGREVPQARLRLLTVVCLWAHTSTNRWHWCRALMSDLTEVTRRLVAVFAADVEGYSRLMGADEAARLPPSAARSSIGSLGSIGAV